MESSGKVTNGNYPQEPPILTATALPPETLYQTVVIDDPMEQETTPNFTATALPPETSYQTVVIDDPVEQESTPLLTVYSNTSNEHRVSSLEDDEDPEFRDWIFAVLFLMQLAAVIAAGYAFTPEGYESLGEFTNYTMIRTAITENEDLEAFDEFLQHVTEYIVVYPPRILIYNILPTKVFSFLLVHITLVFVIKPFPKLMVKATLCAMVGVSLFLLIGLVFTFPGILSILVAALGGTALVHYVQLVWRLVPFAAVNLKVALHGINANAGTYVWAFFTCFLTLAWLVYWLFATIGILSYLDGSCEGWTEETRRLLKGVSIEEEESEDDEDQTCGQAGIVVLLLISYWWTHKVLLSSVEVTVAGVMATWCYDKDEASGCCSSAVASSIYRSWTYSFGSVCLGSLLQGAMKLLRKLVPDSRTRRGPDHCCALCFCCAECLARVLEDVLEYFNQWAYVYVGIYGYSYLDSGKRVLELFKEKGLMSIATEGLASYVLGCISLAMGVIAGLASLLITAQVDKWQADVTEEGVNSFVYGNLPWQVPFVIGFLVGVVVSAVMMSVVKGALNTLIVCFADSPARMEAQHPKYTKEIIAAWSEAFPETVNKSSFPAPPAAEPVLFP